MENALFHCISIASTKLCEFVYCYLPPLDINFWCRSIFLISLFWLPCAFWCHCGAVWQNCNLGGGSDGNGGECDECWKYWWHCNDVIIVMQMQYWNYDDTVWNCAKQIVVMIQCEILTRRVASLLAPGCSLVSPDHDDDHYKRCKNCECCPVSLFIVRVTMIVRHSGSQLSEMSTTSHKFTNHTMSLSWSKRSKVSRIALWRCSLFSLFVLSFCQNTIPDWCRVYIVGAMWDVWMDGLGLDLWVGWGKEHLWSNGLQIKVWVSISCLG